MSQTTTETAWRLEEGSNGTRILWFDRPGRSQNVLDDATLDDLEARLVEIERDGTCGGLVIRSAKPAGFCAGADLKKIFSFSSASKQKRLHVADWLSSIVCRPCRCRQWPSFMGRAWGPG